MSEPAIKICGVNTMAALDAVIAQRVDHAGLVFFPPSPRNVDLRQAADLAAQSASRISRVGLFVEADDEAIAAAVAAGKLDVLQLHGKESPARAAELRSRFGLPVWKAVSVASAEDIGRAASYCGAVDLILFDAKTPKGSLPGGMGLTFDWSLLAQWRDRAPWGLAGGLTPSNIGEARRLTRAPLIDASSGVESGPGRKEPELIAEFCRAARAD